jgi:RNA polymerase sigma-70 factor (ECF subfamily)
MKHTDKEENAILEKARRGDPAAFEQLVKNHQSRIYSAAIRLLGNRQEAEDVLQETFVAFYRNLKRFQGRSQLSTYLFRMAVNFSLMKLRKGKRRAGDAELAQAEEQPDPAPSPLESLLGDELRKLLDLQLQKLPEKDRAVVVLRDIEGLEGVQVARILGISLPAMKSRLHRSRELLRRNLSAYLKDGNHDLKQP